MAKVGTYQAVAATQLVTWLIYFEIGGKSEADSRDQLTLAAAFIFDSLHSANAEIQMRSQKWT
jgi:predicted secreted Zn-dependent protease